MDSSEAASALAAVEQSQARLAEMSVRPLWHHAQYGALTTAAIVSPLLPDPARAITALLSVVLAFLLLRKDRQRYGMVPAGSQKSRRLMNGLLVVMLLICVPWMVLAPALLRGIDEPFLAIALPAAIVFMFTIIVSKKWESYCLSDITRQAGK